MRDRRPIRIHGTNAGWGAKAALTKHRHRQPKTSLVAKDTRAKAGIISNRFNASDMPPNFTNLWHRFLMSLILNSIVLCYEAATPAMHPSKLSPTLTPVASFVSRDRIAPLNWSRIRNKNGTTESPQACAITSCSSPSAAQSAQADRTDDHVDSEPKVTRYTERRDTFATLLLLKFADRLPNVGCDANSQPRAFPQDRLNPVHRAPPTGTDLQTN